MQGWNDPNSYLKTVLTKQMPFIVMLSFIRYVHSSASPLGNAITTSKISAAERRECTILLYEDAVNIIILDIFLHACY